MNYKVERKFEISPMGDFESVLHVTQLEKTNDDNDDNDDIEDLVRKLGLEEDNQQTNRDFQPSEENPGIPAMFLKPPTELPKPKTISKEREERYDQEIKIEKISDNSNLFTFIRMTYSAVDDKMRKQMNRLLRTTTGENFVTAQKTDITYIVLDKKSKVIGYTMVSTYSPENHFKNEGPYLYNFITDISLKKEARCGHALISYVERDLAKIGAKLLNLDVEHENVRAFKFFLFNKYRVLGKYEKLDLKNMNLYEVDKTIAKYKLTDKIKEIKERRGLADSKSSDATPVSLDDSNDVPHKKIKYISLSKTL